MSHNLKNRRHGIFKARSPYAFEGHLGEEFKPVWEGGQVALLNLSNRCFVSATKTGSYSPIATRPRPVHTSCSMSRAGTNSSPFAARTAPTSGSNPGARSLSAPQRRPAWGRCRGDRPECKARFDSILPQAYIQVNNGHYVSAERNHSLIAQRFRPGIPARGDSFILEVGTTHCSFRSQYNRYWVAESNGNLSAVTPASSSRKSAREEFKLEGYRSDLLEPEHIYFGIRTTHGTFVISEDDKIVTVSHDAIQKNVAMASRVGYCFTDHLFEILPQPSSPLSPTSSSSTSSASSPSSSSADFSRSPSFSWAKQSFPPHTLATSSNSGSTHTRRERTESESGNGSPEDSIRYRIGARLRQRVDRKLHRGAPKSLSDHLERSGGRDRDLLAPNPEQQVKRADTEPVDRRHAGVAKSSEALPTYSDRGRRKQENSSGSGGASGGRSGDRMRSVVGSDGDFEAIEVFVDDEEQSDDIEDGWEEITEGSSDDYGYFEARLRAQQGTKLKSPPPKPNEALSPRSAAAAVEAKTSTAVTTTGFDQMAGEWVIDPRDLQLSDRVLGKGFFGEVKKGRWRGTPVAAKIIYRELFRSKSDEQLFDKEVRMLRSLHHPHVIQFLGVCQFKEKRQRCIVTELMEKGSLHDLLRNEATLFKDPLLRVRIARDIAKGMCYLHMSDPPTLHRDLTSKNILLDRFLRAKIADFGLSRFKEENGVFTQGCGALAFMAPEVYRGEAYSEKADVYSYAIVR
ncbi:nonreceptor tyrosine kinase, putative [Acanthamoeba castellanii str. Neff]|uniref:Nonreceptor tyrosine kinase, putative n=1 Tax=Acanthamoeba castellanii (strain ATCC 30010 / Neff) TaxID=1257118 RepID=L8HAM0_ACACF|nr:nonreceptor tyrosine kinase, putative [Acanthamoeba castellanii str. Neff]ELR22297.1 nonreceptor tyrosine kinase, putative [Acanthamoeba castellanii str. Neff]